MPPNIPTTSAQHDAKICGSCDHWKPPTSGLVGNCLRYPPVPVPVQVQSIAGRGVGFQGVSPPTAPDYWCGEWVHNPMGEWKPPAPDPKAGSLVRES